MAATNLMGFGKKKFEQYYSEAKNLLNQVWGSGISSKTYVSSSHIP